MATVVINVEGKMWCGHCGVETPTRHEGKSGTVKSCNWCGKILADKTGTVEEFNKLFLQYQALQEEEKVTNTGPVTGKKSPRRRRQN